MKTSITIHTDGGSRGNPGPSAIGVVIEKEGMLLHEFGKIIGDGTNNVAEYSAVIEALSFIKKSYHTAGDSVAYDFLLDSKLVVEQLNGRFKIKDSNLQKLALEIRMLEQEVRGVVTYRHIPREQNKRADLLVNRALDNAS